MKRLLCSVLCFLAIVTTTHAVAEELVAAVIPGDLPRYRQAHEALEAILRTGGFDESKIKIFVQTPNVDKMSLANSIRRSVAAGASLVITYGAPATLVAAQEVKDAPVLFVDVYDPVALGIVQTLAAPGANRSGACSQFPLTPLLEALQQVLPSGKRLGVLYSAAEASSAKQVEDLAAAADKLGISLIKAEASAAPKVVPALAELAGKIDALCVSESVTASKQFSEIVAFATNQKIPVLGFSAEQADAGALLTLSADPAEQGKLVAVHALQLFAGQKAFILPVREAKKVALTVNLKAAAALSLQVPEKTLATAGRVIR